MLRQDTPEDLFHSKTGRYKLLILIERHVQVSLTPSEYAIYAFISDRTLRFNKRWERITVSNIVNGLQTREGLWVHRGINMEERQVYRKLKEMTDKGYILKQLCSVCGNANEYAINLDSDLFDGFKTSITMQNTRVEDGTPEPVTETFKTSDEEWDAQLDARRRRRA